MFNTVLLLIALLVYTLPTIASLLPTVVVSDETIFVSENITTILLSGFIFRSLTWENRCKKVIAMVIMIVSIIFLLNYVFVEVEDSGLFNYVNEKVNG